MSGPAENSRVNRQTRGDSTPAHSLAWPPMSDSCRTPPMNRSRSKKRTHGRTGPTDVRDESRTNPTTPGAVSARGVQWIGAPAAGTGAGASGSRPGGGTDGEGSLGVVLIGYLHGPGILDTLRRQGPAAEPLQKGGKGWKR